MAPPTSPDVPSVRPAAVTGDVVSLRFAVLGPVRVWRGETELGLGPPKQRSLLALLLVHAGHPVSVHEIVDTLWAQDPPDSAVNVVQRHIGALRRLLEPGLPARGVSRWLVRGSGGYRLEVEPDSLDLLRFRALCQEAARLAEAGRPADATELLIEALDLWRGPTASGIAPEVRSHPVFTAVDREYADAVTAAADHALAAGPALGARILAILRQAAAQRPLDEALQARLLMVLAATGRQVEALDVYRTVRTRLAEDLGLEPGPELQAAQQQVLRQADAVPSVPRQEPQGSRPGTERPAGTAVETGQSDGAPVRPAQLPVSPVTFTGRGFELEQLGDLLKATDHPYPGVVIGLIGGMAGVGKTTLAVHWAHQVARSFPDGQLYVDLRGFHPGGSIMSPSEAIRSFLDAFGVPSHRIPAGLEAQAGLYRSLLADRRVLVVLDNARDSEQVRPLLPGSPGSLVIVTSRNQLYGLVAREGARVLALDLLSEAEAREFLSRRLGAGQVAREPGAAAEIVARCGHLPLALAIVSARAVMSPAFTLASIAAELRDSRGNLDAFESEEPLTDARSVFSWSYRALTPGAARLFRLLALHPGPDLCLSAAASLVGQGEDHVRPLLSELVRAHLATATAPDRYGCHELLYAYATELLKSEGAAEESDARRRLLDHYLHSAHAADSALAPSRDRIEPPPKAAGVAVMRFDDQRHAARWLEINRPVLLAAIEDDARHGTGEHSWRLATALEWYLDRAGRWDEQLEAQAVAVAAAERLGDRRGQAHAHRALGFAYVRRERWDEASEHLSRSLELFGEIADPAGQGRVHRYLAFLANRRQRYEEALEHYERASTLYRSAGRRSGVASVANEVGWTYILMDEYAKALDECGRALMMDQEIGDSAGEAAAWDSLGYAHYHLGDYEEALACFHHALALYQEISDRSLEADTLVHIGDTHRSANRNARAELAWRQALGILDEIGHPDAAQVRGRLSRLREPSVRADRPGA